MLPAVVDREFFRSGLINSDVCHRLQWPCIPILPRRTQTAVMSRNFKSDLDSITYIEFDLDVHVTPKLWLHVVPNNIHDLILGEIAGRARYCHSFKRTKA